jgi:hypothetical protein
MSQANATASPSKAKSKYKLRSQSPQSVIEDVEICEPQTLPPKALFDKGSVLMVARI